MLIIDRHLILNIKKNVIPHIILYHLDEDVGRDWDQNNEP